MAACVVAAVGAVVGGFVDHRIGSKPVIVVSLPAILAAGLTMLALSGPVAFWVCGLLLCLFIGPSQSSSRAFLLRLAQDGKEGVAFGLYTMTGERCRSWRRGCFRSSSTLFGAVRAGLGGICLVLFAGLLAMLVVGPACRRTDFRAERRRSLNPARSRWRTWTPATVTEQVTLWPMLTIVTLAG